jgi:magnesium transporter
MSGSPRSGSHTRFSTPEPDLDDHRNQPETLPRADVNAPRSRRGTLASIQDDQPAAQPAMSRTPVAQFLSGGMIARDFEHEQAIVDDDQSIRSGQYSPIVARRSTYRRPTIDPARVSRDSSRSRSTSPPNSVDAFAAPQRKRRAGTITSQNASMVSLQRTMSNDTRGRRRPTFSDVRSPEMKGDEKSIRSSIEDDVCFPPEENNKTYTIDFEELDEFAAQYHDKTPVAHPFATNEKQIKEPRVFNDLRDKKRISSEPSSDSADPTDEKLGVDDSPKRLEDSNTALDRPATRGGQQSRWAFFSSEADETIHASELSGLTMPGEGFRELFELGPEGGVWWLDMTNPSEEEVAVICKAFGIHPLTREDITTQETREKVELFKSYYFVCFRSFYQEDKESKNYLDPINVYAVVFREGLLTFSFCPNSHAAHVLKRIGRLRDYVNLSADWICYALIDEIIDSFAPVITEIERESDSIEDQVFTSRFEDANKILRAIGDCRKRVMQLSRLLGGKADVIKGFAKRCNEQYSITPRGDVGLYLSDVQDHVVTMMSNLAHFEKMLSRSHSNYLAQISLDNISQGNKANQMLGKITTLATILVPLNLIAGLWGMNCPVPGKVCIYSTGE